MGMALGAVDQGEAIQKGKGSIIGVALGSIDQGEAIQKGNK
jgi:hypothetical protein